MKELAENVWVLPYSLRLFGGDLGRMVTIVRLRSGQLVIHSTGPFTPEEVASILRLGRILTALKERERTMQLLPRTTHL